MTSLTVTSLAVLVLVTRTALAFDHYKYEAHTIMKRMAKGNEHFEDSDVARVHVVEGENKKRLARRDLGTILSSAAAQGATALQLELSSGSRINLALRQSGLVDQNTVVSYHTESGRVEGRRGMVDCYFHGHVEDTSGKGLASVSHCDGLFGFANTPDYRYFLHPIENKRLKRDAEEDYDVHVLWRRSDNSGPTEENENYDNYENDGIAVPGEELNAKAKRATVDREGATGFVIEMAVFSDASYFKRLNELYGRRKDDFLLARLAGTQALYGDREKVGYDLQIKIKLLEYWKKDPADYSFSSRFEINLKSFCELTSKKYNYDLLALNTGITQWNNGLVGLAYVAGACSPYKCLVSRGFDLNSFVGYAHEVGHTLGMVHENKAHCSSEKKLGGFMGGGGPYNFSPCMRLQLERFLSDSRSNCLFEETSESNTKEAFLQLPEVFPGQIRSADGMCEILAGTGYKFGPNEKPYGSLVCKWFVCMNENDTSPEFGRAQKFIAPVGFPCLGDSFCDKDKTCKQWSKTEMHEQIGFLRNTKPNPKWSEWSSEFSECSRTCGTGVRTRRRECLFTGLNLGPYCPGHEIKPELCNTQSCPGDPSDKNDLRSARGNEVCSKFAQENVKLNLKGAQGYKPIAEEVQISDAGPNFATVDSKSCYIKCRRIPKNRKGAIDAIMPDGTLCLDDPRSSYDVKRFAIETRCVRGRCFEFSDCPEPLQRKDRCGICGGDSSRCFEKIYMSFRKIRRKRRAELITIPAGSEYINVRINKRLNFGVVLELWSTKNQNIIGDNGKYSRKQAYEGPQAVPFAGTRWTYNAKLGFYHAPGPLTEPVVVKAIRLARPIRKVMVKFAKP